jgi:serine/threonine protein kinase
MASSLQGKSESHLRLVSDEDALVFPENAPATDNSPTVISKTKPIIPSTGSSQDKVIDLAGAPESIVAGLRGQRLAHFELIEPIGVGGMAAVIRARDTQLDRFVALKILPPEMAKEPDNIQRFRQEARAAAKLDHENIARVYYCGEDQGLHFIAFEFVEGMNLRALLEQRGRLSVAESVGYLLQIATGLEHAATRGVVHRDVKPSNIIITPTGRAKLVDMGLARNLERCGERDLTHSGMTLGTFDYLSPEQALEPREADARSDIYSLGCTFYHMLTGRPPVPDGTAAKKMHHHQHLAPLDPREIDSTIPDDVVAILNRMMAKNPKDRYQRPIHLVHHLMQLAKKVGVADDLPDGMLFIDAPLPNPPGSRPVLIVGLALVALVVVTMLVSFGPEPYPRGPQPPLDPPNANKPDKGEIAKGGPKQGVEVAPQGDEIKTLADLKLVLVNPAKSVTAKIKAPRIDLDGVVFKGSKDQRLELSADDVETSGVKFTYQNANTPFGLVLEGGDEIIFRRIKFEIDSVQTEQAVATVAVRGAKTVRFEQCIFPQTVKKASLSYVPIASVLIEGGDVNNRPNVFFSHCFFDSSSPFGGQAAIAINGPANIAMSECAFKPHAMFFHFRDKCTNENTSLKLDRCTGLVVHGPAFRFTPKAGAHVSVDGSVFTRPTGETSDPLPGLISFEGDDSLCFKGQRNIYHNLDILIERKSAGIAIAPNLRDVYEAYLGRNKGWDRNSLHLLDVPGLSATPLAHRNSLADSGPLIFQLKPEFHENYGLRQAWTGAAMPLAAAAIAKKEQPTGPKRKVVDANDPGAFRNIAEALARADNGDVIYIKHADDASHDVYVAPVPLKRGMTVTLKPFEGCTPILKLDPEYTKKDTALFTLEAGKLQIEHMEILLEPTNAGQDSLSAVHLGECAQCVFKNCIFSLRATSNIQLSVVTFVDLAQMMKLEPPPPFPARVECHECFVRGKGDLVALRGCRGLDVEVKHSLVALDGSLLKVEAAGKPMAKNQGVRWTMDRSSIFTTESLFALRSKTGKVLTETEAKMSHCLLVSLELDQPVVLLEKAINGDLAKYLKWTGEENYYANFSDQRRYQEDPAEQKSEVGKLNFPKLDNENRPVLWDALPEWFTPAESERRVIADFGLPLETRNRLRPALPSPDE